MTEIVIANELARQFAYECFDVIIRDIKASTEKNPKEKNADEKINIE